MTILEDEGASAAPYEDAPVALPRPRGPVSGWLLHRLRYPVHDIGPMPGLVDDPITGEDGPLALYLCYELHYLGLPDVDEAWEWEPSLLAARRELERAFEARLAELVGHPPVGLSAATTVAEVARIAHTEGGPSLSGFMAERGTVDQMRELAIHRSAYQLKEADPHTFGIPRLTGGAKAAMVEIQRGEYGNGDPAEVHATLFGETMRLLGLDDTYGAYLEVLPATTLATVNLASFF
ncbi:MAG: iron-containing redox enzyme family protein, partial [Acidimicrobiales bacterium]|nr:iron-containing redox enzyme family protein [Acidimicrobiales bacterium]